MEILPGRPLSRTMRTRSCTMTTGSRTAITENANQFGRRVTDKVRDRSYSSCLVQHHLQERHRVIRFRAAPAIHVVHQGSIQLIDLTLNNSGQMVRFQSLLNLFPAGGFIGQREGSELGFLFDSVRLHSQRDLRVVLDLISTHNLCEMADNSKVTFLQTLPSNAL
jgi:hypothetical protein